MPGGWGHGTRNDGAAMGLGILYTSHAEERVAPAAVYEAFRRRKYDAWRALLGEKKSKFADAEQARAKNTFLGVRPETPARHGPPAKRATA